MSLNIFDLTSIQIVLGPVYLLFILSFFLLHSCRRTRLMSTQLRVSSDHVLVYSYYHVIVLSTPFFLLFWLLMASFRGFEGFFFLSQMYLTAWHMKWFFFSFNFFCLSNIIFSWATIKTTLPYIYEIVLGVVWLFWCINWALSVTNLIIFIFFLEIFGLLLLVILLYMFSIGRVGGLVTLNNKLFNTTYGAKFFFIQTFIFFLWSSVISMLFLFWSSLYLALITYTLELPLIELFYEFNTFSANWVNSGYWLVGVGFLFFSAILLKTAVLPLQFWLIAFYKHLPLPLLFTYLSFYYIYFVVIIMNLFFGYLYVFTPLWYWYCLGSFSLTVVYSLFNLTEAVTVRGFFAYSSVINLFTIFVFMISSFDSTLVLPML